MYCVLFNIVRDSTIGEELIDKYSEDNNDARAVFVRLKQFHEESGVENTFKTM